MGLTQKQINQMGVFTEDWNCCFNPKPLRSRRQRVSQSGARISGFTAVFCDDWKDEMPKDDTIRTGKRKRRGHEDENIEYPFELGYATEDRHAKSSQHERRHKEPYYPGIQEFTPATIPKCQPFEHETYESRSWCPISTDSTAYSLPSFGTSVYDSDHASPSTWMPWDTAREMSTFSGASPIGIEHWDASETYLSPFFQGAYLGKLVKQTNTALSEGKHNESLPLITEPSMDMGGFGYDHWAGLLNTNINLECGLDIQSGKEMSEAEIDRYLEELLQY